jgi:hypothetical protein
MAEYIMAEDETAAEVARALLDQAASPDDVHWSPRPDVPGGGVFVVRDEEVVARVVAARAHARAEAEQPPPSAEPAGEEADEEPGDEETEPLTEGDEEPAVDDPTTPEDEAAMTPTARRAARRAKAAAQSE